MNGDGDSKARILELLRGGGRTAAELAGALAVTSVAVRRHLGELQAQGLVRYQGARPQGRGRPQRLYELSDRGWERFGEYARLCQELLEAAQLAFGAQGVHALLAARNAGLARGLARALIPFAPESWPERLAAQLSEAGYAAEARSAPRGFALVQRSCPHRALAQRFPEVCGAELALYRDLLPDFEVRQHSRIRCGFGECRYTMEPR